MRAGADVACVGLQHDQPQYYGSLTSQLSPEQQAVIQAVFGRADEIVVEQARAEQLAHANLMAAQQQQAVGAGPGQ